MQGSEIWQLRVRIGADGIAFGGQGATIADQARRAEDAGFDSFWIGDHIVSPTTSISKYPYTPDGSIPWSPDTPMYDAVVSASFAAAHTERIDLAFGVLVLPLRHPLVIAKQLATLDRLSHGRLVVGCGSGWLAEEFTALQVPFESRQARLEEWIRLLRGCWTGRPGVQDGDYYKLPVATACYPTPVRQPPILIGGASARALELAGRLGDGWYPILPAECMSRDWLQPRLSRIRQVAEDSGRDPRLVRVAAYAEAPLAVIASRLPELVGLGISEVVVAVDWTDEDAPGTVIETLRTAVL